MKKAVVLTLIVSLFAVCACTHASKHCKSEHRKAKKNNIGWKY